MLSTFTKCFPSQFYEMWLYSIASFLKYLIQKQHFKTHYFLQTPVLNYYFEANEPNNLIDLFKPQIIQSNLLLLPTWLLS